MGAKHPKVGMISDKYRLWSRISAKRKKISTIGKRHCKLQSLPHMTRYSSELGPKAAKIWPEFGHTLEPRTTVTTSSYNYTVSQKVVHQAISITLLILKWFSKFLHCHILQKICNKTIIEDPTTPKTRRYTTSQKYIFENSTNTNNQPTHSKGKPKRAWTKEDVIMVDKLVQSQ